MHVYQIQIVVGCKQKLAEMLDACHLSPGIKSFVKKGKNGKINTVIACGLYVWLFGCKKPYFYEKRGIERNKENLENYAVEMC